MPQRRNRAPASHIQRSSTAASADRNVILHQVSRSVRGSSPSTSILLVSEAKNRIQRGALARSFSPIESEDASLLHTQIDTVKNCSSPKAVQARTSDAVISSAPFFSETFADRPVPGSIQKFSAAVEAESLNSGGDPGPFVGKKFLAFPFAATDCRRHIDEHAEASPHFDEPLVNQLLIAWNREWIGHDAHCHVAPGRRPDHFSLSTPSVSSRPPRSGFSGKSADCRSLTVHDAPDGSRRAGSAFLSCKIIREHVSPRHRNDGQYHPRELRVISSSVNPPTCRADDGYATRVLTLDLLVKYPARWAASSPDG